MTMFNVIAGAGAGGSRNQVLIDEQQMAQLQAEFSRRGRELERLRAAMETLTAVNAPTRFVAAAMALCNELASRWKAERVGVGFLKGRYVRLQALSHTEKITRHMQLVQDMEGAMEECLDQDVEVMVPPPKDASFVYRATEIFARRDGVSSVCSFPLRRNGSVVAVLTVERKGDRPLSLEEIETLRLTCDLFTSRLKDLYDGDRFIAVKMAKASKEGLSWIVGTKHTWAKVIAIAVIGLTLFGTLVKGKYEVNAPFTLQASEKQIVPAPFEADLKSVNVSLGDMVFSQKTADAFDRFIHVSPLAELIPFNHPKTVLATLNAADYYSRWMQATSQYQAEMQQARILRDEGGKEAEARAHEMTAAQYKADADLNQQKINDANVKTPIDGIVFWGDWKQKLNAPLKQGDDLFEIGELSKLRAELEVSEDQIPEIQLNQTGQLASNSYPGQHFAFTVELIEPWGQVSPSKTSNIFKVRGKIDPRDLKLWMRPGMQGNAKVDVGEARYLWIYTHRPMDWVRMKLWTWGF